jgi:hypothetical protein
MSSSPLNTLGKRVLDSLIAKYPEWSDYVDVIANGDLELAMPAPVSSRAGHLIIFTSRGEDIWVRYAPGRMCYSIDSDKELHNVIEQLLSDRALFVVITRGEDWVETTLIRPGDKVKVRKGQVAQVVSWSGRLDQIIHGVSKTPRRRRGGKVH